MGFYKSFRIANILTNLFSSKNLAKIVLFGVILLIIGLFFSNNVLAVEDFNDFESIKATIQSNKIVERTQSNQRVSYFFTSNSYLYTLTNSFDGLHTFYVTNSLPDIGTDVTALVSLQPGESYSFVGGDFYLTTHNNDLGDRMVVTYEPLDGMPDTIDNMSNIFSVDNLWSQLGFAVPLIAVAVLFAIGLFIVIRVTKGTSKGKMKF